MSIDKEGLPSIWPKGSKWPNWSLLGICIGLFFLGYIVGEHMTQKNWEAELEKMVQTNVITIGYKIPLGLTEEKRKEILEAMEFAKEERESELAHERP
jgi:hypothetical protein